MIIILIIDIIIIIIVIVIVIVIIIIILIIIIIIMYKIPGRINQTLPLFNNVYRSKILQTVTAVSLHSIRLI